MMSINELEQLGAKNTNLISMTYEDGNRILLGDEVKLITGELGQVVYECGAFGIGVDDGINYESLQIEMDKLEHCCGNTYSGCFNNNFISLFEIYWNFNCEENMLYPVEKVKNDE